jgi:NTE family protein
VYWKKVSALSARSPFAASLIDKANPEYGLEHSLGFIFFEPMTFFASPYIDFERVRRQTIVKLFFCATNVQTAKVKIFEGKELDVPRLLACTCLTLLMQAVEVDGEFYWDGSYSGNLAIFPLVYNCDARDILMVHITPAERPGVPTTSPAIMNRMQEISFNTTLIREMRTIAYLNRQIEDGKLGGGKRMLVHLIEAEDLICSFSWSSRLNGDWNFLQRLFELGRARVDEWLVANFDRTATRRSISTTYF